MSNNKLNRICAYGTLRKGEINHRRIIADYGTACFSLIKTTHLPGWKMYDKGWYPYVVRSGNPRDTIVVEIFVCSNRVYDFINDLEIGAGYYADLISIDDEWHTIYAMTSKEPGSPQIDKGDWVEANKYLNPYSQFDY